MDTHTKEVTEALRVIRLIRRNPAPQSTQAEKKVLGRLSVDAYIAVIAALEQDTPAGANPCFGGGK